MRLSKNFTLEEMEASDIARQLGIYNKAPSGVVKNLGYLTQNFLQPLRDKLNKAIEILGDMIINPEFNSEELEKERGVILAEMRTSKDDIEDLSFKRTNEIATEPMCPRSPP